MIPPSSHRLLPFIAGLLCSLIPYGLHAWPSTCHQDDYDRQEPSTQATQKFRSTSALTQSLPDRREAAIQSRKSKNAILNSSKNSNTITGSIAGDWEFVTGWVGFPYTYNNQDFFALVRGFDGTKQAGDEYSFSGWDGKVFWIDMGDGIPHLVPSQLLTDDFEPFADDIFTQSGKLYDAGFVLFRAEGETYPANEWEEQAAWSHLLYVTDANDQVLEVIVDVYNDNDEYLGSTYPRAGDQLQLRTHAYDLNDPQSVWMLEYMDFKTLTAQASIEKAHYLPQVDYKDPSLATRAGAQFDTSSLNLKLLLDAGRPDRLNSFNYQFAFNTPEPLGYTWGEARQAFNTTTTTTTTSTTSSGGGTFDWMIVLFAGLGGYRLIARRKTFYNRQS